MNKSTNWDKSECSDCDNADLFHNTSCIKEIHEITLTEEWIWRETYVHTVLEPLPKNWKQMSIAEKAEWVGDVSVNAEGVDSSPDRPYQLLGVVTTGVVTTPS